VVDRFAERRRRFLDAMEDGVAVFRSWPVSRRNGDVENPYRADSDFFLLTGFDEPESYAVLVKQGADRRYLLFVRPRDPEMETWVGRRAGLEGAVRDFHADEAFDSAQFFDRLPALLTNRPRLYLEFGVDPAFDGRVSGVIEALKDEARKGLCGPWQIVDPRQILWQMRLHKTDADVADLEAACAVTVAGFRAAFGAVTPGMNEGELAAVVEFEFRRRGAPRVSFETICASGANAATLHYIRNDATIDDGDLVLIDAGAEVGLVSADISRTFPANGRFTALQRRVYEWVLKAQEAAIAAVKPGTAYAKVHEAALKVLVAGLIDLGALKGTPAKLIETGAYRPWFMHRIGHWLGSDVHDVGPYFVDGASIPLEAGMVLTIEPGLYFADVPTTPKALRGIGIRIEDDVLVTAKGRRVLTGALPKTVADVEAAMADRGAWWNGVRPITVAKSAPRSAKSAPKPTKAAASAAKKPVKKVARKKA